MAVTAPGASRTDGGDGTASGTGEPGRRLRWMLLAGCLATAIVIAGGIVADRYQPLTVWNGVGGFPGINRPVGTHLVNSFGAQTGELYIPPQHGKFAIPVSLYNTGSFAVTIEDVSLSPPNPGYQRPLRTAGTPLYWNWRLYTGFPQRQPPGRPIPGLSLKPGNNNGVYIAVLVRTPRCYLPHTGQVISYFYVKERFLVFTRWVRVPLNEPLLLRAPAPRDSGPGNVCLPR